jgi:PAS domain S-box-containing protein
MDSPHELVCTVMLRLRERLGVAQVALAEVDEARNEAIVLRQAPGDGSALQVASVPLDLLGESRRDSRDGQMVVICEAFAQPVTASWYARCCGLEAVESIVSAPLRRSGELVALLIVGERSLRPWSPSEVELIRRVAEIVWPALEKARADRALAVSEQRLRLAQAVAQIGAWEFEPQTRSVSFSPESCELFGLGEGEPELYQLWMSRIDARDRGALDELMRECESTGAAEAEYRYQHPQRGERWIYCRAGRTEEAARASIVGVSLDVTGRRQAEEALKGVNQRKDQFLAMLGHELRNPLAPIRNAVQILSNCPDSPPQVQWASRVIERQTRHLARLVDDLLDVARTVRGQITLQTAPVQLSEWIQLAVETTRPLIGERRHQLHVNVPRQPVQMLGDLTRLGQALANLLNNAARYTPEGGEIWLDARLEAAEVEVRVSDTGPGLGADLLPRVFDLFSQADRPLDRSQGGLGIGLTLVKTLVEMHGGTVEARNSDRHPGAEFVLRLPSEQSAEPNAPARADSAPRSHFDAPLEPERPMRVLIVDDNVDAAESVALLLRLDGFQTRSVNSAAATFDILDSFEPEVVLLDIGLPVMNGYELARRLKARFPDGRMRIVALSGYGQPADRERAARAGFDDYLVKPVEPERLGALLRSLQRA